MAERRMLVKTPRGFRSIITGSSSATFDITKTIPKGSSLIRHNKGVIVLEVFYKDSQGYWESLKANTDYSNDPLNEVWVYSGQNLGSKELKLKS